MPGKGGVAISQNTCTEQLQSSTCGVKKEELEQVFDRLTEI